MHGDGSGSRVQGEGPGDKWASGQHTITLRELSL